VLSEESFISTISSERCMIQVTGNSVFEGTQNHFVVRAK
jgi:hypothetical protein